MDVLDLILARFMPRWWLECRIQLDRLHNQGQAIGLSREQVDEVLDAWNRWYQQTPWPFDWDKASEAVTRRSLGLDWEPPKGEGIR